MVVERMACTTMHQTMYVTVLHSVHNQVNTIFFKLNARISDLRDWAPGQFLAGNMCSFKHSSFARFACKTHITPPICSVCLVNTFPPFRSFGAIVAMKRISLWKLITRLIKIFGFPLDIPVI